ncbi:hypothetical protein L211DRAFT_299721 [Terfezia boudieri ATCC MYA-4762]|uniref:Uncharacterized protein n=1 Tax=Terfezia boudieri ATCC MYA-4762 TaxID=1051890 RepID=A0A3N4LJR2_9PEZI|nr:hypothetical protein L211DRAFT_299721 [Terfezia boudieri ATCC MYA-4762]
MEHVLDLGDYFGGEFTKPDKEKVQVLVKLSEVQGRSSPTLVSPGQGNVDTVSLESAGWAVSAEVLVNTSVKKILNRVPGGLLDGRNDRSVFVSQAHQQVIDSNDRGRADRRGGKVPRGTRMSDHSEEAAVKHDGSP